MWTSEEENIYKPRSKSGFKKFIKHFVLRTICFFIGHKFTINEIGIEGEDICECVCMRCESEIDFQ